MPTRGRDVPNRERRRMLSEARRDLEAPYKGYFRKGQWDIWHNRLWSAGKGYALVIKEGCPWYVELQAYNADGSMHWTL